jgi:molecular chaperone DnaJ
VSSVERDYYEILGVPRDADESAIKKAFRGLARELHPDVSDDPDSEARFREVAEAYEVLSKTETREVYDRFGHEGLRRGGFTPSDVDFGGFSDLFAAFFGDDLFGGMTTGRRRRGGDVLAEVEINLAEAATSVTREVSLRVASTCAVCHGSGAKPGSTPETCRHCGGAGRIQQVSQTAFGQFVRAQVCPVCNGGGKVVTELCPACGGEGRVVETRTLEVRIPAGIHDGQRIRLSGEGHAGIPGGPSGDAYVLVRVRPDSRFARDGDDIVSQVDLTMTEAALGATLTVATLDGDAELVIRPGTQPGEIEVLRGKGMPSLRGRGRGDHRILVNVRIPQRLTDEQRRTLERFAETVDDETYDATPGLFDRIRAAFR